MKAGAAILCAGLFYGYVLIPLGLRIACPFRTVTGLRCPGCGVTDLCLSILYGRFAEAAGYNWGLTLAAPGLLWLVWSHGWRKDGPARGERTVSIGLLLFLLGWAVFRNICKI